MHTPNAFAMLRSTMHIPHVLLLNIKFWRKRFVAYSSASTQHKLGLREDVNGEIANHLKGEYMKFKIIVAYFLPGVY